MRDAVGSTWVYSIVIVFTLIFTGFMVMVMVYSKAYKVKNEVTSIIEKYQGVTNKPGDDNAKSLSIINNYLESSAYTAKGNCFANDDSDGWYGVENLDIDSFETADKSKNYYYCFRAEQNNGECHVVIKVFYYIKVPVLGNVSRNSVEGQTNTMKYVIFGTKSGAPREDNIVCQSK